MMDDSESSDEPDLEDPTSSHGYDKTQTAKTMYSDELAKYMELS